MALELVPAGKASGEYITKEGGMLKGTHLLKAHPHVIFRLFHWKDQLVLSGFGKNGAFAHPLNSFPSCFCDWPGPCSNTTRSSVLCLHAKQRGALNQLHVCFTSQVSKLRKDAENPGRSKIVMNHERRLKGQSWRVL